MKGNSMLSRRGFVAGAAGILLGGFRPRRNPSEPPTPITVYKSSSCGCCAKWVDHVRAAGFKPEVHDQETMDQLKDELGIPAAVRSCHSALVGRYLIEGH